MPPRLPSDQSLTLWFGETAARRFFCLCHRRGMADDVIEAACFCFAAAHESNPGAQWAQRRTSAAFGANVLRKLGWSDCQDAL
jgi:hypothetical protein